MRKSSITISIIGLSIIAITSGFDILDNDGKAGRTGSPGEGTCTGCHTGSLLNDGTGSVTITSPDLVGWEYNCGQTYTINVTVSRTGNNLFGFDCEALTTANQNGGTLVVTNSQTHILNATVSSVVRKNMVHSLNGGASADSHTFTFNWTAPMTNVGDIKFYVTGNAANGNNLNSGDHIYSTNQNVTPAAGTGISSNDNENIDFSIFPNPVAEQMTISFTGNRDEAVLLQLFSMEGKQIAEMYRGETDGSTQTISFDTPADLPAGIYFVRFVNGATIASRKVVVN